MESTGKITINFEQEGFEQCISVTQYDTGKKVRCNIAGISGNIGAAMVYCKKPSGLETYTDADIVDDHTVEFYITEQMNAETGCAKCQLQLFGEDKSLTSYKFKILVQENMIASSKVTSADDYPAFRDAIEKFTGMTAEFSKKIETEKTERQSADATEKSERQAADAAEKTERMQEISVERARINNLVANNNPTEGNSELIDMRIGYDGTKYGSAGEAVRGQVSSLSEDIKMNTSLVVRMPNVTAIVDSTDEQLTLTVKTESSANYISISTTDKNYTFFGPFSMSVTIMEYITFFHYIIYDHSNHTIKLVRYNETYSLKELEFVIGYLRDGKAILLNEPNNFYSLSQDFYAYKNLLNPIYNCVISTTDYLTVDYVNKQVYLSNGNLLIINRSRSTIITKDNFGVIECPNSNTYYYICVKPNDKSITIKQWDNKIDDDDILILIVRMDTGILYSAIRNIKEIKPISHSEKRILFMGDSITHLTGDRAWTKYFNEIIDPNFSINISVSGATWQDKNGTVYDGNPVFNGADNNTNNVIGNQVQKVINAVANSDPDYDNFTDIIIAAGTNGGDTVYTQDDVKQIDNQFYNGGSIVPLETVDRKTWAGAMRYTYEKLRELYPNANIIFCTPIQAYDGTRPYSSIRSKSIMIHEIAKRLSDVFVIDSFECGIFSLYEKNNSNGKYLLDGLHPNTDGAKKLGKYNAKIYKLFFD